MRSPKADMWLFFWLAKQFGWIDAQLSSQFLDYVDRRCILAALETADIGSVNLRTMGQFFLRQTNFLTPVSQIGSKDFAQAHGRERAILQSI